MDSIVYFVIVCVVMILYVAFILHMSLDAMDHHFEELYARIRILESVKADEFADKKHD